ncbi:MAG: amidohydrolase family protein [Planctomycetes bacterium]|nr:amidohydrolase family protein [Planctomycetota bacterium]
MRLAGVMALALALPARAQDEKKEQVLVIRAAKILTMGPQGAVNHGVIVVRGGKIVEVGENAKIPEGATVLDAGDSWAMPGFVDLHCHVGGSMWDINEMNHPRNPELSTKPTIEPDNELLLDAVAGGVTTVLYIPGSGTNISGFGVLMNTGGGRTIEDLVLRFPGAMKVAQAWNPERWGGDLGFSRMGMWWALRRTLDRAKAYHEACSNYEKGLTKIPPAKQPDLELMRGLFERKYPVIIHTADARDVMGTARIFNDEYKLAMIVSHGEFGGFRAAPEIAKRGLHCNIGPRIYDFWYFLHDGRFYGIASKYLEAGVKDLSLNTDSPVVPQEDLGFQAAMAVRYGLPVDVALRGLTIAPARAVLADEWVGSLEPGKHADVVLWSGEPLDVRSYVRTTIIKGKVVYDAQRDGRRY